ncbi:MAG TPA: hypothetical protein VEG42_03215 [Thermoplasmata archaeon]|nr:hypothetical protein [Thermoplasmata archaeon]
MRRTALRADRRGGALLDLIVGSAFVLVGAFALASVGVSLPEILHGAGRFFGFP